MITDPEYFELFKRRALAREKLSVEEKFEILESLYREARQLGQFGDFEVPDHLEDTIRLAAALNAHVSSPPR